MRDEKSSELITEKATAGIIAVVASLVCGFYMLAQPHGKVNYPTDYREWVHVKSALVGPASAAFKTEAGIHHINANRKALEGYRSGKFPEGSVIVYRLLETSDVAGNTIEGQQRRVDVMVKDSQRHRATGG